MARKPKIKLTRQIPECITREAHLLYKTINKDPEISSRRAVLDGIHTVNGALRVTNGHFLVQRYNAKQMDGMIRPLKPLNKAPRESFENVDLNQSDLNKCKDLKGREYEICDASGYPDTYHLDRQMAKDKRRKSNDVVRVGINADYLRRIAEALESDTIELEIVLDKEEDLTTTLSPIRITKLGHPRDKSNFAVLMPMRVR